MQTDCPEIAGGRWQFGAQGSVASALSSSSFEFVGVVRPFAASLKSSREGFDAAGFDAASFVAAGFGAAGFEFVRRLHGRVGDGRARGYHDHLRDRGHGQARWPASSWPGASRPDFESVDGRV